MLSASSGIISKEFCICFHVFDISKTIAGSCYPAAEDSLLPLFEKVRTDASIVVLIG